MIGFSVQSTRENDIAFQLGRIRELARKGIVDPAIGTLTVQGRLATEACMEMTPFKTMGQARKKVTADLERIFKPLDPKEFRQPRIRNIVRTGDKKAWDHASQYMEGRLRNTYAVLPSVQMHREARGKRGRVKTNPRAYNNVTLWPERAQFRTVLNAAMANVGWARAGWLRAYRGLGGTRAPAWVTRHSSAPGDFEDGRNDPTMPYVGASNATKYFTQRDDNGGQRLVWAAMRKRESAMRRYYEEMMRLASEGTLTPFQAQQAQIGAAFFQEAA
jgi:hypothetical protein